MAASSDRGPHCLSPLSLRAQREGMGCGGRRRFGSAHRVPTASFVVVAASVAVLASCSPNVEDQAEGHQLGFVASAAHQNHAHARVEQDASKANRAELVAAEKAKPDFPRVDSVGYAVKGLIITTRSGAGAFNFVVRSTDGASLDTRVTHHDDRLATFELPASPGRAPIVIEVNFADRTETYEIGEDQLRSPGTERLRDLGLR